MPKISSPCLGKSGCVRDKTPLRQMLKLGKQEAEIGNGGMENAGLWISAFCFPNFSFSPTSNTETPKHRNTETLLFQFHQGEPEEAGR